MDSRNVRLYSLDAALGGDVAWRIAKEDHGECIDGRSDREMAVRGSVDDIWFVESIGFDLERYPEDQPHVHPASADRRAPEAAT